MGLPPAGSGTTPRLAVPGSAWSGVSPTDASAAPGSRGGPPPDAGWDPSLPPIPGVDDVDPAATTRPTTRPALGEFSSSGRLSSTGTSSSTPEVVSSDRIPPRVLAAVAGGALLILVVAVLVLGSQDSDEPRAEVDSPVDDVQVGPPPSIPFEVPPAPPDDLPADPPEVDADEWDPLVADLAAYVEEERDLRFKEPVTVELIGPDQLMEEFAIPDDPFLSAYIDQLLAQYRGLGILQGAPDVLGQMRQGTELGLLGYYDPVTDVIRVRDDVGGEAGKSPFQRAVLVHELTHALQDQYADLSRPVWSQEELTMQRMMVEGDARRIERAYVASLPPEESQQYEDTIAGIRSQGAEAGLIGVLGIEDTVVYEGGREVTRLVRALDSSAAVDLLLRYPPDRPAQLLRVSQLFLHGQEPWAEDAPDADYPDYPPDAVAYDGGSLGAWLWYVTLATRIDPAEALRAADAIGSDRYVLYEQGGRNCANYELVPSGAVEAAQLVRGVRQWATAVPHGASVEVGDEAILTVTVCDPGVGADMAFVRTPSDIVGGPIARLGAVADVMEDQRGWWAVDDLKERERWCLAESVQRAVALDEALAGLGDDRRAQLGEDAVKSCLPRRVPGGPPPFEGDCSSQGLEPGPAPEGLPEVVAATRAALLEAATSCDFAAISDLLAPRGPYLGDTGLADLDDASSLAARWERQESNGQSVLADLVNALDAGHVCGPEVMDAARRARG